jgi:CubicO group peptidase (beta-lactamase class C family)
VTLFSLASAGWSAPSQESFKEIANHYIRSEVAKGHFSGSVLIALNGKPFLRRAYGLANREEEVPAKINDEYEIGSTSKTFTAVAIAKLVASGRVSLNDRLTDRLLLAPSTWKDVTIAHLLSHESGIPEFTATTNSFRALMRAERSPAEILKLIDHLPLSFSPGTKYRYTNSDFLLLGMIVEQVSGQPFEQFVTEQILRPLGLRHTGFLHAQNLIHRRAYGYMREGGHWVDPFYIDPSMLFGAGGMYSTVDDLLAWDRALHGNALLPSRLRDQLLSDRGHGYGLGFFVDAVDGHGYVGHGGNLPGFSSDFERFRERPLTFILLSNTDGAPVERMTRDLASMYFRICTGHANACTGDGACSRSCKAIGHSRPIAEIEGHS